MEHMFVNTFEKSFEYFSKNRGILLNLVFEKYILSNSCNNFQRTNVKQYMRIVVAIYETMWYNNCVHYLFLACGKLVSV